MALYPDNQLVAYYAGSVLTSTGNFLGLDIVKSPFQELDAMDRLYSMFSDIYLTVPADRSKRFFQAQKEVYDHLSDECFSYSAPTSMGKSFVMRMFIKAQIVSGIKMNFALIVPTKALINEVRSEIIKKDLAGLLEQYQYHVISAASDMALEIHPDHNFILV
ncbi:MAG: helicase, partial [Parasporobacterium sp.]|nr:helicase [Parasporobacterium sp.]